MGQLGATFGVHRCDLRYAYKDATGWYTQTVDSSGRVGIHPSLALGSAGKPHISYRDIDHQDLKGLFKNNFVFWYNTLTSKWRE